MSAIYYVDAAGGNDSNSGLGVDSAFCSLAKVQSVLQAGDVVNLRRGATWHEDLYVTTSDISIRGYGDGANPLIHGDFGARAGILIAAPNCLVEDIDVTAASNGIYITGASASGTVIGGTFWQNGSGIVAGGGGRLILADGVTCIDNRRAFGAGDGIQISQDASTGTHTIINANLSNNENSGLNGKVGTVAISDSMLSYNGEPGWIAQNDIDIFRISNSIIRGNNRSDNGVGQASLEDHATVYSTGNVYDNPDNGVKATVQINIISYDGKLFSVDDRFINDVDQTNTIGSIRVNTGATPVQVSVLRGTFEHASGSGIAIDGYGATGLTLWVESSTFLSEDTRAVRLDSRALGASHLDFNRYFRADSGPIIDVDGRYAFAPSQLSAMYAQIGLEQHGVALTHWVSAANHSPLSITLSETSVSEDLVGALVGDLAVIDPDDDAGFSFSVSDSRFAVVGTAGAYKLALKEGVCIDYEAEHDVALTVTATDAGGLSTAQTFDLNVLNASETTSKALVLRPLASTSAGETHAALVVSQAEYEGQFSFNARVQTTEQLRQNSAPNPWESAWLVWGYQDNAHFYYFTLKTNGWELGKVDPAYPHGQRFLATGDTHPLTIGAWNDFDIAVNGSTFTITVDGQIITSFTDTEGPLYTRGKVGFYTEDAEIRVDAVVAPIHDGFESYAPTILDDGDWIGPWQLVFDGFGTVRIADIAADSHTFIGSTADDWLYGTELANDIEGNGGNDHLLGAGGNDILIGGSGNDVIIGGDGTDTAVFAGNLLDYTIGWNAGAYIITDRRSGAPDGVDNVSEAETYQFADRTVTGFVASSAGLITSALGGGFAAFYDPTDLQDWSAYLETYNGSGQRLTQSGNHDDGTSWKNFWDPGNSQIWSNYAEHFNAACVQTSRIGTYDSGEGWANYWDSSDFFNYASYSEHYVVGGAISARVGTYDDGQAWANYWDPSNLFNYNTYSEHHVAGGAISARLGTYDDGQSWANYWDPNNLFNYSSYSEHYVVGGAISARVGTYDDGQSWANYWDASDLFNYSSYSEHCVASGAISARVGTYDDGQAWANYWDPDNLFNYSSYSEHYVVGGARSAQIGTYDNGESWKNFWDPTNIQAWASMNEHYATSGDITIRITTWDDGHQTTETFGGGGSGLAETSTGTANPPDEASIGAESTQAHLIGLHEPDWLV